MKRPKQRWMVILVGLIAAGRAGAQLPLSPSPVAQSRSGQFSARVLYAAATDPALGTNTKLIRLDPTVLVVSCERTRELLWRELGVRGAWNSRVSVLLYPALTADEVVTITSDRFRDGWQYQVYMPQMVERSRYLRGLIEVMLLELANRSSGDHGAEIPPWLVEGLARRLLATSDARIILPSAEDLGGRPVSLPYTDVHVWDPLTHAHDVLSGCPPLSFQDLSWPDEAALSGADGEAFGCSAQLLVSRLLGFQDGRACLRSFLAGLTSHYNWQFAFVPAFRSHFSRPIELEKWWAIQAAEFTGRPLDSTWSEETSLAKLAATIRAPVEVRLSTNDLPLHAEARLQNMVRDWAPGTQDSVLQAKIVELEMLRRQVSPKLAPLVDDYRKTLVQYLKKRDKPGLVLPFRHAASQHHNVDRTVAQLDALDTRRRLLSNVNSHSPVPTEGTLAESLRPGAQTGTFSIVPPRSDANH